MEKDNTFKYIAMGVGALAAIGGIWYILTSAENSENEEDFEEEILTMDVLKKKLLDEISELKDTPKMDGENFTQEFMLMIFRILKKYVTMVQLCDEGATFNKRIEMLREGNEEEYIKVRRETKENQEKNLLEVTGIIYKEFDFSEEEYAKGFQTYAFNPEFTQK